MFITGTDTNCGKTTVTLILMRLLQASGLQVIGMKPVATGAKLINGVWCNEDALLMQQAGSINVPYALINPYIFAPPTAPHIAAIESQQEICPNIIRTNYKHLTQLADIVIVEGIGGWLVPLGTNFSVADLPTLLQIPVLLVVSIRLGCINHALLTASSIQALGCTLVGWIANHQDPNMLYQPATIASIAERISAPYLGSIPYIEHSSQDMAIMAQAIDKPGIARIFSGESVGVRLFT